MIAAPERAIPSKQHENWRDMVHEGPGEVVTSDVKYSHCVSGSVG